MELRGFWCGADGCVELRGVLNGGVFDVELKSFWCGTEGFRG